MEFHSNLLPGEIRTKLQNRANPKTPLENPSPEQIVWTWGKEGTFYLSIPGRYGLHLVGSIEAKETGGSTISAHFGPTPGTNIVVLVVLALFWVFRLPSFFGLFTFAWGTFFSLVACTIFGYLLFYFGPAFYYAESRQNMIAFIQNNFLN